MLQRFMCIFLNDALLAFVDNKFLDTRNIEDIAAAAAHRDSRPTLALARKDLAHALRRQAKPAYPIGYFLVCPMGQILHGCATTTEARGGQGSTLSW